MLLVTWYYIHMVGDVLANSRGRKMKVVDRIKADPRTEKIWYEGVEDGWWVELKSGWMCPAADTHCVHEWNLRDLLSAFIRVKPCDCDDCKACNGPESR